MINNHILDEFPSPNSFIKPPSVNIDNKIFQLHLTNAGNAEALSLIYGGYLLYVHGIGWHFWNGYYWVPDEEKKVIQAVKNLAKYRQNLIIDKESDQTEKKRKVGSAMKLEESREIENTLKIAQSMKPFSCQTNNLDNKPTLLCCPNGTLNLEFKYLFKPDPKDLLTKCTSIPYLENAKAPRFEKFLEEIFVTANGKTNYDLIDYVHKALGYSITGYNNERCFFICIGEGANGKSTLFNIIHHIMSSYSGSIPISSLLNRKYGEGCGNDIAGLQGKRFVTASESGENQYLNEEKIKLITGGDPISCRFLYKEYFVYYPTYKIWLACNHKPRIKGTDHAIWDRIKIIPFNGRFEKDKPGTDSNLFEKLKSESEGILKWLVDGAEQWFEEGLKDCGAVKAAVNDYRSDEDIFIEFLLECIRPDKGSFVTVQDVWTKYNEWAKRNGYDEMANTKILGHAMKSHGYKSDRKNQQRGYLNVKII